MTTALSDQDKKDLLDLARRSILAVIKGQNPPEVELCDFSPTLREHGACFVTLTLAGRLRGCVGSLEAERALVHEVQEKAVCAAFKDFRFSPLQEEEYPELGIEISCLTPPEPLDYEHPEQLVERLHPGQDGVILSDGPRKATFLPQVWDKLSTPEEFLNRLCLKMGARPDLWKRRPLQVETYQVVKFSAERLE